MKKIKITRETIKTFYNNFKKFMKKHYVTFFKEVPLLFCFIITALINTLLLRIITVGNFVYVKPLIADLAILFILSSFMFLFKTEKKRKRYLVILSFVTSIICVVHSVYYTYYASFASVSLLATSTFVVDVGDAVVEQVLRITDLVYLWQPVFVYFYYIRQNRHKKKNNIKDKDIDRKFSFANMFLSGLVLLGFSFALMTKVEWGRFGKMWNRESVVSSFGIFTYQINDICQSLEPKINNLFGHDKAYRKVNDYYSKREVSSSKNEYTNLFEGKNVIVIHAESLQTFAMNRSFNEVEVTPFLNQMARDGIFFSNYYSEVGVGTSSDAEFTFSTSLMPSSNGTVFVNYFDREYSSIQQSFKNKGYYVFSMHGNTGDFWNRATMHKNLGYDKFYSKSSFDVSETIGLGISDKSFFHQAVGKIKEIADTEKKPFYGTLITLTNHTPWSDMELMDEYDVTWKVDIDGHSVVRSYLSDKIMGNYLRSVHYMDQAIEQFIHDMDDAHLLDNTVIVIYGDHDARISKKSYDYMNNYDPYKDVVLKEEDAGYVDYNEYNYRLDKKVPFIIWSKDKKVSLEVKTVTGMIDAAPILENLFGVERNPYQLGHDILGTKASDNTVVFVDGSYVTNSIYYNGQNGEIYSISGDAASEDYVHKNSIYADELIDISNDIITYDLIKEMKNKNK